MLKREILLVFDTEIPILATWFQIGMKLDGILGASGLIYRLFGTLYGHTLIV